MSEAKDGGKPGGWFPDFNSLLLALLAGTLFVTQVPFHKSRPRNPDAAADLVYEVNARPWQDPFEAVDKYIGKDKNDDNLAKLKKIQDDIKDKAAANGLPKINVVAVMLPGGIYYEDGETRRKLRYAVLSGFNAALHYMPESSSHIQFSQTGKLGDSTSMRAIYEWMVYQPTHHNQAPQDGERRYKHPPVLLLWLNNDDFTITPHQKLKHLINAYQTKNNIGSVAVLGPFDSRVLQDLVGEMADKKVSDNYRFYSPSATVFEFNLLNDGYPVNLSSLQDYFDEHGLSFLRVTATDGDLADSVKNELKKRGIEPGKRNRILLVGEWDSLYTWHLTNTFADVFLKERTDDCKDKEKKKVQDWNKLYPTEDQCIFRASYLRGLDGEKLDSGSSNGKSPSKNKHTADEKSEAIQNLEEASGDSQFDYVRRLAAEIEKLDGAISRDGDWDYHDPHAIKAIGILGSDVYDKLLITEALRSKFPDAVFFTNGIDARFIEPKNNEWARNMIMAGSYGLTLDRYLQTDIPPFRDNTQTAFFLATEMALINHFDDSGSYKSDHLWLNKDIQTLLRKVKQVEFDKLLKPDSTHGQPQSARLFEVGRTQSFDLNAKTDCTSGKTCLHPKPDKQHWNIHFLIALIVVCGALLWIKRPKKFLGQMTGLRFVSSMTAVCYAVLAGIHDHFFATQNGSFDGYLMFKLIVMAVLYACLMFFIVCSDERLPDDGNRNSATGYSTKILWCANMTLIAVSLGLVWFFVKPQGLLDSGEPYALWNGVSMWPSQAVRFVAFILTGYYIIEVAHFPQNFTWWLKKHFCLREPDKQATRPLSNHLWDQWWNWKDCKRIRNFLLAFFILFSIEAYVLWFYRFPHVPYRGMEMFSLNMVLLQGLLLPASLILLVLVSDVTIEAVKLVEKCFPDDAGENTNLWSQNCLGKYASHFNLQDDAHDVYEWVGMRFIGDLTRKIYDFIGCPLIIALLIVLASSSYFDNWIMPIYMKLSISLCLGWLLYWDRRLKKAADKARENALKLLRFRAIRYQSDDRTKTRSTQLERLISMIENHDAIVYKSFIQRPIFQNSLLIMLALLADSVDYYMLASKLFQG